VATVSATIAWWLRESSTDAAGGPLADVARSAFAVAALAAWLLGVAGVAVATVITMRRRRRDAELLSALGADRSEFRRAVSAELAPLVGFGLAIAAVAAWITVTALEGRLDLDVLRVSTAGADPSIGVERRGVVAPLAGATFAVMGSLFVAAVGVMRLAIARLERTQRVVGEAGPR
jgi:ABC-type antimicrobial peptide transport system permease subunit